MDTSRPHDIKRFATGERAPAGDWLPLTETEAAMLAPLDVDGRAAWFAALPRGERRRRQREAARAAKRMPPGVQ